MLRPGGITLRELHPQMTKNWNTGNEEFRNVVHMVRDAVTGSPLQLATVNLWLRKAEETNPPSTEHGRLVHLAGPLLREYAQASSEPRKEER